MKWINEELKGEAQRFRSEERMHYAALIPPTAKTAACVRACACVLERKLTHNEVLGSKKNPHSALYSEQNNNNSAERRQWNPIAKAITPSTGGQPLGTNETNLNQGLNSFALCPPRWRRKHSQDLGVSFHWRYTMGCLWKFTQQERSAFIRQNSN